jgi:hypothetical protein
MKENTNGFLHSRKSSGYLLPNIDVIQECNTILLEANPSVRK